MENKVIIDDCNVAECEFFDNGEVKNACKLGYWTDVLDYNPNCVNNKKCVFKKLALQLQRAKAENETLHITIEKLKGDLYIAEDSLRDYQEHYNKLDAENEKLKAEVKEIRTWEELKLSKYRKALEEVREWLLKWRFNANIIKHTNEPLNKINEVLNERI